ncbi:DUF3043 domain-containing protein [Antrihabitans stalactiti]|uniref:DUF3043 domain-containing protein n=1 Tax=Antrihabitans stalactiti TaxID=2584121 RepID=A0A848KCD4_9NOCA|nr:DUF3043 domain-containing protein [Antrihabitans stalactiti]
MKLLRRGDDDNSDQTTDASVSVDDDSAKVSLGKGRPTPKRRDAEARKRGPVAPAPLTSKEARARRKTVKGTKEDRKVAAAARREAAATRRERMAAGDDAYLLPRDKGPVRAFVRDIIDSRRNLVGMFMPLALVLIVTMFISPLLQFIVTFAMLVMMLFMIGEGVYLGKMVNKRVAERFPDSPDGGFKLGWYAFTRASQIKKMRLPKPRVKPGDAV